MTEQETTGNGSGDPEDAAEDVEEQITSVGHFGGAGDGWAEGTDDGGETGENDGAAAILFIEVVSALQMAAAEEEGVFAFVESGAGRSSDPVAELIADDSAANYGKQPAEYERRDGNSSGCREDACGDQQGIAGEKEADEKAGLDEDDATNESGSAGADEFFQSFRVEQRADEVDKRIEHATWFLIRLARDAVKLKRERKGMDGTATREITAAGRENVHSHTVAENAEIAAGIHQENG